MLFSISPSSAAVRTARPEAGGDPVMVGSYIATALQTIVSRNVKPVDTAVVTSPDFTLATPIT
ncbi:MAG: hypothetical protein J2P48_12415 [Alphaproteobacteria bacterium]|nr:hypothetical protein [Alphaproteobacteria bacterium]